jgi:DNA polymerase-3 subunit epsilon
MASSWHERRMCALDVETTSPDPEEARIVSATVAFVGGDQPTQARTVIVNPGVEIPEDAQAIHGLSTERVRAVGLSPAVALPMVLDGLSVALSGGYALVVFNARYDLTVLDREVARHGLADLVPIEFPGYVVDPLVCDKHLDKYRAGSRKLQAICEQVGARLDGAHDAEFDAIAAGRLAWVIGERGRIVRRSPRSAEEGEEVLALHREWAEVRHDLPKLHAAQQRWAADQAAQLERYFHEGNPSKDVPPQPDRVVPRDWPYLPAAVTTPLPQEEAA